MKFHLHEKEFHFSEYSVEFMTTLNVETDPLIRNFVTKSHAMSVCVCMCPVCVSKKLHMYLAKAVADRQRDGLRTIFTL